MADQREVVPPSQVLETMVGIWMACQRDLLTAAFSWAPAAELDGDNELGFEVVGRVPSPVKTFT
jgi:hypothetical protein